jgi:hypothetical protein
MLVAQTADGSRPGYWGIPSWDDIKKFASPVTDIVKKVGQTIMPGGDPGYYDLYGGDMPQMPQGSPGQLNKPIEDLIYGMPQGSPGQLSKPIEDLIYGMPQGSPGQLSKPIDIIKQATQKAGDPYRNIFETGAVTQTPGSIYKQPPDERNIFQKGWDKATDFLGPKDPYVKDGQLIYPPNIAGPIAGGMAAGAIQAAMPKTPLPQDTSGIDIADIRSRALTGSDPDLHFLPKGEATTAYAQGGRTGYYAGDSVEQNMTTAFSNYKNAGGREEFDDWFSDIYLPEATQQRGIASLDPNAGLDSDYVDPWAEGAPYGYAPAGSIGSPEGISIGGAQGGRIGADEGGLMNLGGMEKDYRQEGGFVPLGGEEKADDVPARLSKNEFVFTADAVRAAGGGDIDAGAEVMENVMNNLEQGGQISEESQGLEGARDMFATAQKLEGVL